MCVCDVEFETASALVWHMRTHPNEKPFLCQECVFVLEIPVHWRNMWEWSPKGKKPFFCTHSHGIFSRSFNLKRHVLRQWGYTIRIRKAIDLCSECGARFVSNSDVWKNSSAHTGEKNINPETAYEASHWKKAILLYKMHCCFQTGQSTENVHEKSHRWKKALRLYTVSQCDLLSHQRNRLKDPLRIHTGERPFSCKECGDSFQMSYFVVFSCKSGVQVTG